MYSHKDRSIPYKQGHDILRHAMESELINWRARGVKAVRHNVIIRITRARKGGKLWQYFLRPTLVLLYLSLL